MPAAPDSRTAPEARTRGVERFALLVAAAASLVLLGTVLWRCRLGFDFTDEGYYLASVAHPSLYVAGTTEFGFVYHPIFQWVTGTVPGLRRANVLVTAGLGWTLCFLLLRRVVVGREVGAAWDNRDLACAALVLSTSTLAWLNYWLPTPSYNSLNLQALLLAGIGFILVGSEKPHFGAGGWIVLGASVWLDMMAKPPSGAALCVVVALSLAISGRFNLRRLALSASAFAALCLLAAWTLFGSIPGAVERVLVGYKDVLLLQAGHTISESFRWDSFDLGAGETHALIAVSLAVFTATWLAQARFQPGRILAAAVVLASSLACVAIVTGRLVPPVSATRYQGLQYAAAPFGALAALLAGSRGRLLGPGARERLGLVTCFACLPFAYAFGSNTNYWFVASLAAFFWVVAGVVLATAAPAGVTPLRAVLPLAAFAQLGTAIVLFLSMENPYRQTQPLWQDRYAIRVAPNGSGLLVSRDFADYIDGLATQAAASGFKPGDPLVDLTGHYPGMLYLLGAKSIGAPWLIGGYPGSGKLAAAELGRVPRGDLERAWILAEPAPTRLPTWVLTENGMSFPGGWREVGTILSPNAEYPEHFVQHLFRPVR